MTIYLPTVKIIKVCLGKRDQMWYLKIGQVGYLCTHFRNFIKYLVPFIFQNLPV